DRKRSTASAPGAGSLVRRQGRDLNHRNSKYEHLMKPPKDKKCGVCAIPSFERNNYFYGKLLTVRDSVDEQCFINEKRGLINRMVLGSGVVCGLDVTWDAAKRELVVSKGLALDCCGREILVCGPATRSFPQYEEYCRCLQEKQPPPKTRYVLCVEYCECPTE